MRLGEKKISQEELYSGFSTHPHNHPV